MGEEILVCEDCGLDSTKRHFGRSKKRCTLCEREFKKSRRKPRPLSHIKSGEKFHKPAQQQGFHIGRVMKRDES